MLFFETKTGSLLWSYDKSFVSKISYREDDTFIGVEQPRDADHSRTLVKLDCTQCRVEVIKDYSSYIEDVFCCDGKLLVTAKGKVIDTFTGKEKSKLKFPCQSMEPYRIELEDKAALTEAMVHIKKGRHPDIKLPFGHGTRLNNAVQNGYLKTTQYLLQKGADPFQIEECTGSTLIYTGAMGGSIDIFKILLSCGLDVNAGTMRNKSTPLHQAAIYGREDITKLLLQHNADPNALDSAKDSPLHKSVAFSNIEISKLLVEAGAKTDMKNRDGETPMSLAQENGSKELIVLFEKMQS